ncbi:MAG: 5'/3'-nucleotidase SurE [Hyphomonadaceae bacterium]|nr:5'/3'-nucleotidase SurE [Hyphomonadaceae bacterium]MBX3511619.1 5'/3'-nucleotidase SurE [Hyphomonadaceae bacterium]
MRILCTNDDGIHATGLAVLEKIARRFSDDVWVIAPESEQSGASRALTLTAPIRVRQVEAKRFAITGTPTDCVLLGVEHLIEGAAPDLVLSGVNRGQNIAEDVTFSGTIAGAMQGMQLGIPAIALSQARGFRSVEAPIPWETAEAFGPGIVAKLLEQGWPKDVLINVNFPDLPPDQVSEVEVTSQGRRDQHIIYADKRTDPRGGSYFWLGFRGQLSNPPQGADLRAIYEGRISVTPLHVDLTHMETVHALKGVLGGAPPKAK